MANSILLIGTIGQSVWRSEDGGETWSRGKGGLFLESDVRSLHHLGSGRVLAGAETGVYESRDAGVNWERLPHFPADYQVWTLGSSEKPAGAGPGDGTTGRRIWAGTCPAALFYSDDDGATWNETAARWLRTCAGGSIRVRITSFLSEGLRCWAGAEIDGIQVSEDGGETWSPRNNGLISLDIHSLARLNNGAPSALAAATNAGLCLSEDEGISWKSLDVGRTFQWAYCRGTAVESGNLLVGCGSGPPGSGGALWKTADRGRSWEEERLPVAPNSTIWQVVTAPGETWAYSVLGQVFRRVNGSWKKLTHEFGEIRALCVLPGA